MRLAPLEDQLTKIGVVSDENSAFRTGGRQNLLVLDARLVVDSNRGDIVSLLSKKGGQT